MFAAHSSLPHSSFPLYGPVEPPAPYIPPMLGGGHAHGALALSSFPHYAPTVVIVLPPEPIVEIPPGGGGSKSRGPSGAQHRARLARNERIADERGQLGQAITLALAEISEATNIESLPVSISIEPSAPIAELRREISEGILLLEARKEAAAASAKDVIENRVKYMRNLALILAIAEGDDE